MPTFLPSELPPSPRPLPDSLKWEVLMKTESGEAEEYTISYQNLLPSTRYVFRVVAYNVYGISYPAEGGEEVRGGGGR